MAGRLEDMLWKNIRTIKNESDDEYVRSILEARSDFLRLRLKQEPAIRQIYTNTAGNVAQEIREMGASSGKGAKLKKAHLVAIEKSLRKEADSITEAITGLFSDDIAKAVEAGAKAAQTRLLKLITESGVNLDALKVQRGFGQVNTAAVEACWGKTHNGLTLSDRIWKTSDNARTAIQTIIQEGVAQGRDAVAIARDLEKYVRSGANTLAKDYPNMRERMKRVPKDLSYEALRLARTETANAYWEGTISSSRMSPTCKGVRFMLSNTHPIEDICDDLASADLYGLGPGGYAVGDEPPLPHPNCLCTIAPIMPSPEEFEDRWEAWENDPSSQPNIEKWYNKVYSKENPLNITKQTPTEKAKPKRTPKPKPEDAIKQRIAQGINTEQDAVEVGSMVQSLMDNDKRMAKLHADYDAARVEQHKSIESLFKLPFNKRSSSPEQQAVDQASEKFQKAGKKLADYRQNQLRKMLEKIRPMATSKNKMQYGGLVDPQAKKMIDKAARYFPAEWVDLMGKDRLSVTIEQRGYFRAGYVAGWKIALSPGSEKALLQTAIHELGHYMESIMPRLRKLEQEFWERRTSSEPLQQLNIVTGISVYRDDEVTKEDNFIDPYMGKYYDGKNWEIMSMGLEGVLCGAYNGLNPDPDYRNFILGVLAGL